MQTKDSAQPYSLASATSPATFIAFSVPTPSAHFPFLCYRFCLTRSKSVTLAIRLNEALALAADPRNCHERWHFGNHYRSRNDPEAPVHYFFSVISCMQAGEYTQPGNKQSDGLKQKSSFMPSHRFFLRHTTHSY
jgi:hypothetical protein